MRSDLSRLDTSGERHYDKRPPPTTLLGFVSIPHVSDPGFGCAGTNECGREKPDMLSRGECNRRNDRRTAQYRHTRHPHLPRFNVHLSKKWGGCRQCYSVGVGEWVSTNESLQADLGNTKLLLGGELIFVNSCLRARLVSRHLFLFQPLIGKGGVDSDWALRNLKK